MVNWRVSSGLVLVATIVCLTCLTAPVSAAELKVSIGILGSRPSEGEVMDISRGGAKIIVGDGAYDMKEGKPCIVSFDVGGEGIRPRKTIAVVRRVDDGERVPSVAVEFDAPLETLGFLPLQLAP